MDDWSVGRGRLDRLRGRLRTLGIRETLAIQRDVLQRIVKSTLAATLAWIAADLIHSPRPALASLAAILVVQLTVRASLARGLQLTIAVTLGLAGALLAGHLAGLHWWSISLVVLAGLISGEVLRLGVLSSQVAISAMLAMSLGAGYGIERVLDTAIGALIGAVVSVALAPPTYVAEAGRALRAVGEDLGALLADIGGELSGSELSGSDLSGVESPATGSPAVQAPVNKPAARLGSAITGPDYSTISRWLSRARDLATDSRTAIAMIKQGEDSMHFNPRSRRELAQLKRLSEARRALDHVVGQVRGITRSLIDLPQPVTDRQVLSVLQQLGPMLIRAGIAVAAFGRLLEQPESVKDRTVVQINRDAASEHAGSVLTALDGMPVTDHTAGGAAPGTQDPLAVTEPGRLLSSILVDVERLLREIDIDAGVHRTAVSLEQTLQTPRAANP